MDYTDDNHDDHDDQEETVAENDAAEIIELNDGGWSAQLRS